MSRWWGSLVVAAVLCAAAGCGWADDNYQNAEARLQRSSPNLTVDATTTTLAAPTTMPGDRTRKIPVRRATPGQIAAARDRAARERAASAPSTIVLPDGRVVTVPRRPGTYPTTTAEPRDIGPGPYPTPDDLSPLCRALYDLTSTAFKIRRDEKAPLSQYRLYTLLSLDRFTDMARLVPAEASATAVTLISKSDALRSQVQAATTPLRIYELMTRFVFVNGAEINRVLAAVAKECPTLFPKGFNPEETFNLS
ncbi:MAG: hypothetical protein ACKOYM_04715 [Actinomycetes bacterium]